VQLKVGLTSCESLWYHFRQNVPEEANGFQRWKEEQPKVTGHEEQKHE
jgi:hypothetical protein